MLQGLELVPPRAVAYRGALFEEMDADAVLLRDPEVALVDELAHTNVPGAGRAKRWEDVVDLLAAGIEVITTVNVQHLESLNDVVADVTGVRQRETVPDWVVELADQVELVDMSPHALQRRMLHGNVYPDPREGRARAAAVLHHRQPDGAPRACADARREPGRRDAAVALVEGRVRPRPASASLVCVSHPASAEDLVRRGARIAQRARGDLLVVHVRERDDADDAGVARASSTGWSRTSAASST